MWLSPALLLLGVFLVYPVADTVRRSFQGPRSEGWVGFDNYQFIIDNPQPFVADTHGAILNNLFWLIGFPLIVVPLGLVLAVLTSRVRYEAVAKSTIFIPMAISFVAAAVIWKFMYEFNPEIGTANAIAGELGRNPTAWLQDTRSPTGWLTKGTPDGGWGPLQVNNLALIGIGVWMWTGFSLVVLSAGLKGISTEVLEAARVDGANEWQIFRRIILPMISPTLAVVTTTLVILALKLFDLVWVTTGGRFATDVVATLFFKEAFVVRDYGVGAALAVVLLLAVVPVMVLSIRRFQFQEEIR
ncbi:MAG: sugar ABC transporter permease [Dehalococcoidia bacterium]|nr:sugar ABC transporter permease [Dehalococcoidia bacterium]